jgi:hypothetical protein
MRIRTMRKALVGLVGTVAVGMVLAPAPAVAKTAPKTMEFLFQGGDEPFGTPPVAMSMTGKDPLKPTKVMEFVVIANWVCDNHSMPNETLRVPIDRQSGTIGRTKDKGLYFKVDTQILQGSTLYTYQVWGGQHRKDPRWWVGKARMHRSTDEGEVVNDCDLDGADEAGAVFWKARLVKACRGTCDSPFYAPKAHFVGQ